MMREMNLILSDAEFIYAEKVLMAYIENLDEVSSTYMSLVTAVSENALEDPNITARLNELVRLMNEVSEKVIELSQLLKGKAKKFIGKVDEADSFVY